MSLSTSSSRSVRSDSPGATAAADFLGKIHAIGDACRQNPATLVPVILDGENAWEYYAGGGRPFLRALYAALEGAADVIMKPFDREIIEAKFHEVGLI